MFKPPTFLRSTGPHFPRLDLPCHVYRIESVSFPSYSMGIMTDRVFSWYTTLEFFPCESLMEIIFVYIFDQEITYILKYVPLCEDSYVQRFSPSCVFIDRSCLCELIAFEFKGLLELHFLLSSYSTQEFDCCRWWRSFSAVQNLFIHQYVFLL